MSESIYVIKRYYKEILTFGLAYSCVIVFSLFGPVLLIVDRRNTLIFSLLFLVVSILVFHVSAFKFEKNKKFYMLLWSIAVLALGLFSQEIRIIKIMGVFVYSFLVARICKGWTISVYKTINIKYSKTVLAFSFFLSFFILYVVNVFSPHINKQILMSIPLLTCGGSVYFYTKLNYTIDDESHIVQSKPHIWRYFIFLFIVYICGGVSYSGIYPFLEQFCDIDRYYNVLPLDVALLILGIVGNKISKRLTFALGIGFLGVSFVFFILDYNIVVYFGIQTLLQLGWAFVNVFGFSYSWYIAKKEKDSSIFGYCIGSIMLGVLAGSLISHYFDVKHMQISVYAFVTLVPLFISIIFFTILSEEKSSSIIFEKITFYNLQLFMNLTPREKEVIYYYYLGKTMKQISSILYISPNTVKTHIQNVYQKLEISSKQELQEKVERY